MPRQESHGNQDYHIFPWRRKHKDTRGMIKIENLHKSFGDNHVRRGVNLDIPTGETIAVIGESGCGKSVLLKNIVGLLRPDEGRVVVDDEVVGELSREELFELRKRFGFLFQGSALFDSMNVWENITLSLRENGAYTREELDRIVREKLDLVGLRDIEHLKPSELSGGMKKRVGLARALAGNPDYILYDEPTTGLDPVMSEQIDRLIAELTRKLNVTSIVVTHDLFSVLSVAHAVAMLHDGKIEFHGTPEEFQHSASPIIKNFLARYLHKAG